MTSKYKVIGVMSGSSLDGLDLVLVDFVCKENWTYEILDTQCLEFTSELRSKLKLVSTSNIHGFVKADIELGQFIGASILKHYSKELVDLDLICSHGHTALHNPSEGFTLQIGNGSQIAAITGKPVICDLRSVDIALGGQGAPIVPMGERYLFPEFNTFLNIGGICNISRHLANSVEAFDIGPGNTLLNEVVKDTGRTYDKGGELARIGHVLPDLLDEMNNWQFYKKEAPKSLSTEELLAYFLPLFDRYSSIEDKLRTIVEHIALNVSLQDEHSKEKGLVTGGGAHNEFLIERISTLSKVDWQVPAASIVDYKEAIIIAFLGILRWRNENNVLSSVTGASRDSIGGALYFA